MLKTGEYNKIKKEAVYELISTSKTKKITNAQIRRVSAKYNLSERAIKLALENFLNFGKIDCRTVSAFGNRESAVTARLKNVERPKYEIASKISIRKFTSQEAGNLLHEYLFSSKLRTLDYLIEKEIAPNLWYSWIRELKISGSLLGRKILSYDKYKKLDVHKLLIYARNSSRITYDPFTIARSKKKKWVKGLTKVDEVQIKRASRILYMYL